MESIHHIKSRIKTVQNVGQITRAMEMVAATKMRKSQEVALRSRPYSYGILEFLHNISSNENLDSEFVMTRDVKNTLIVIIASDKGLTGAFNTQVLKSADAFFTQDKKRQNEKHSYKILAIGKKSLQYALKNNHDVIADYSGAGDYVKPEECSHIAKIISDGFLNKKWDRVMVISTHFRTTLKQEVLIRQLLPMNIDEIKKTINEIIPEHGRYANGLNSNSVDKMQNNTEHIFEPSQKEVLENLMPHILSMQLYHIILEANASEHSARRVAMKTASDNADGLSEKLILIYNKARQANITTELIEITSTQQAL
jgi:F-type H+-transporting ATPase subunit gamma